MTAHGQDLALHQVWTVNVFATEYVSDECSAALSASGAKVEAFSPDRVQEALSQEGVSCVILWQDPAEAAATAMETGKDLLEVTEAWLTSARHVLALFRRNRRRLLLAESRLLTSGAPQMERDALRDKLQLEVLAAPIDDPAEPDNRLALLLARLIVPQIAAIRTCLDELEASSFSLAPRSFSVATLTAAAEALKPMSQQASRLKFLNEENSLLKSQVALQQKEIEQVVAKFKVQQSKLQKERDRLAGRADSLLKRLDELYLSTSWRVTRPLRMLKRLMQGKPPRRNSRPKASRKVSAASKV